MDLLQLESIIKTELSVRVPKLTDNKYPGMSFTNEISDKTPSLPNVYVHEMEPAEVGNSIPNQTIHAIRHTVQIEVTANTNKADARIISSACINAMKGMRYSLVSNLYTKTISTHKYVIRMRRIVANGDKL